MARKDLAAILVEEKILVARDMERLERERAESGRPLWSILLDAELTTDEELFFLLAQSWSVATEAALEKVELPEAARRVWSRSEALLRGMLPVEIEGPRATVIMIDPSDEDSLGDLIGRLKLTEARVLLGRRSQIERAIARVFAHGSDRTPQDGSPSPGESTAQVKMPSLSGKIGRPQPRLRSKTEPKIQAPPNKVEIDPKLAEEMQRLGPRALEAEALTPMPRMRRRRVSSPGGPGAPGSAGAPAEPAKPFTIEDALRAEERLSRALLGAVEVLSRVLEERLAAGNPDESGRTAPSLVGAEMARLSRRVARKLGLDRRSADEIGAAAYLFAVDRKLRQVESRAADWFGELGWAAANEDGLLSVLRSLTANTAGFSRTGTAPPLGARIITVIDDYLQLGAASSEVEDLGTVSQLLRTSPAGAPVVDALLRVLESERVSDPTPATTVTATSVLHPRSSDNTPEPGAPIAALSPSDRVDGIDASEPLDPIESDKTQRKPAPTAPPPPVRARREKE